MGIAAFRIGLMISALLMLHAVPSHAADAGARCAAVGGPENMKRLALIPDAPTGILEATLIPAERDLPESCRIKGIIAPNIGFEMRLPTGAWNGKLMMVGCGGMCGGSFMPPEMVEQPLVRNYAVVATNMGHVGNQQMAMYALNNLQGAIDFGSRATHLTNIVAKAIADLYYGKPPTRAYFDGCSTGGRQAMIEAQRFPADFDGIIGGAPPYNETEDLPLYLLWGARANLGADGKPILDSAKMPMVHEAVMAACDEKNGLKAPVLLNPMACKWDPEALACKPGEKTDKCLTSDEIGVVRKIYAGAADSHGKSLYPGISRGSELEWGHGFLGSNGKNGSYLGETYSIATQFMTDVAFFYSPGSEYSNRTFDYDRDVQRLALMEPFFNAQNPDLRKFKAAGGKFILYHGWDDDQIPARLSVNYYEMATRAIGGQKATEDFFRLFMIPGMGHCHHGPGGDAIDWITSLENWVEKGQAPDAVIAYHIKDSSPDPLALIHVRYPLDKALYDRDRPVYAYPGLARWTGKGDPNDAANWTRAAN